MKTTITRALKTTTTAAVTAALMALGASGALAHVSVSPESTTAGGYSRLTFNVPSESERAKTNKLEIELPSDAPFTSVRVKPVEGWTARVVEGELPESVTIEGTTITKAPLSVVWTANDEAHQIGPDQYQTFSISVGKLPEAGATVVLPAVQSYSDGSVREWTEVPAEGEEGLENPAPSFTTTEKPAEGHAGAPGEGQEEPAEAAEVAATPASDTRGAALGWIALGAAVLALVVGGLALLRTRAAHKG